MRRFSRTSTNAIPARVETSSSAPDEAVVTVIAVSKGSAPRVVGRLDTDHREVHTVGIDEATNDIWIVYADPQGDWVQRLRWTP